MVEHDQYLPEHPYYYYQIRLEKRSDMYDLLEALEVNIRLIRKFA